ncbi:MAG: TIGR00730 family Rossman fold protein [Candidatus Uhrbacteria bacterium]|nr:TIGR00730 family Rossman fold protein [Candidatus Uhrbacteria bacterium]
MKKQNDPISPPAKELPHRLCRLPRSTTEQQASPVYLHDMTWRIFRIMAEFVEGFEFLSQTSREITFFGSARLPSTSRWYKEAEKLAGMLGKCGFTIITGGGPGIMEAANKGATEAGAMSVGLNIELPREQRQNEYVQRGKGFHYFFTRKVMLSASSQAYIYFPGGIGTLNEFFEIIELIQTEKMQRIPVVLVGKEFWSGFMDWSRKALLKEQQLVDEEDLHLFHIVDTAEEAFDLVSDTPERTLF